MVRLHWQRYAVNLMFKLEQPVDGHRMHFDNLSGLHNKGGSKLAGNRYGVDVKYSVKRTVRMCRSS